MAIVPVRRSPAGFQRRPCHSEPRRSPKTNSRHSEPARFFPVIPNRAECAVRNLFFPQPQSKKAQAEASAFRKTHSIYPEYQIDQGRCNTVSGFIFPSASKTYKETINIPLLTRFSTYKSKRRKPKPAPKSLYISRIANRKGQTGKLFNFIFPLQSIECAKYLTKRLLTRLRQTAPQPVHSRQTRNQERSKIM